MVTNRSKEKELLDLGCAYYTPAEFEHCHKMLFRVNKLFGFFGTTLRILKRLPNNSTILDVGCGAGLFVINLSKYFPHMKFIGTDISQSSIKLAKMSLKNLNAKYSNHNIVFKLQKSTQSCVKPNSVDVIMTTMVCHHLDDEYLITFLKELLLGARKCIIINDLHRSNIAQLFFRILSPILFSNRLITHDGLISIRRGFKRDDWEFILSQTGIKNYSLKWCFPFRWSLIIWK